MKTFVSVICAAAIAVGVSGTALAKPDKPLNAASVGTGTGCFTHGANGVEMFSAACTTFATVKTDAEGNIQHYIYHDDAPLQEGQTAPDSAVVNQISYVVFGLSCTGTERITPNGNYSSNQVCTPL